MSIYCISYMQKHIQIHNNIIYILSDMCDAEPCLNGGTCTSEENMYNCSCPDGYIGINCETGRSTC